MTGPVVIAAGGTGGHVFPALALARALLRRGHEPAFVTDRRGIAFGDELAGVACHAVRSGGLAGRGLLAKLRSLVNLALGTLQARRLLRRLAPSLAVGFGGYASVPPLLAAASLGVPTILHEANAVLGRANRLLAPRARAIATAFPETARLRPRAATRTRRTGNPVRPEIIAAREIAYLPPSATAPFRLLVIGGSQGARVLGRTVPAALAALPEALRRRLAVSLQCRAEDLEAARQTLAAAAIDAEVAPFFADIAERLGAAHLVIARAGASTVAELACVGRPAILVPYARAVDDHQSANAAALAGIGAAWVITEAELDAPRLGAEIACRIGAATLTQAAASAHAYGEPDAAERLAALAGELIAEAPA